MITSQLQANLTEVLLLYVKLLLSTVWVQSSLDLITIANWGVRLAK